MIVLSNFMDPLPPSSSKHHPLPFNWLWSQAIRVLITATRHAAAMAASFSIRSMGGFSLLGTAEPSQSLGLAKWHYGSIFARPTGTYNILPATNQMPHRAAYVCGEKGGLIHETPYEMGEAQNGVSGLDIDAEVKLAHSKLKELTAMGLSPQEISMAMKDLGISRTLDSVFVGSPSFATPRESWMWYVNN
ncbi:hypothetical protein SAY87_016258 [Trapa incisa]|uniref:Uncharacterized protein n=1 Tax=Trapa incisa TaxID=236973 RepID=A0AAN7QVA4_9MYRT|nr:hypothetical protein SAY87_016258 [Trapa incisa]